MKRPLIPAAMLQPGTGLALLGVLTIIANKLFNLYHKAGPGMSNDKHRIIRS